MLPFVQQRKGNVMDLEALIARLEGTDGVFGVNGGDAVCKEAAALLRMQADIIASRDEHRLVLTSYEAANLREALRAVARGNSPLRALHTGDWLGSIVLMLEQKKIDREPNRRWEDICKRANEREDRPGSDDFYVCPFCDCNSNAHSPRCCDKAAAMKPSDYHAMVAKMQAAGIPKRAVVTKDGATVVEGPLVGMGVILADRDEWKRRALAAEASAAKESSTTKENERAEIHSLILTGNEPHGGVTMVIDRGAAIKDRYLCVEIPEGLVGGFAEALAKVASRPPMEERQ